MAKQRIGILGGTFNPIHLGHLRMAEAALRAAKLDQVLLLPDRNPPHKQGIAPAEDRWRMVCAAAVGLRGIEPSRLELDRTGTTYSFDTLTHLTETLPKAELYFIIGDDTVMELRHWYRWADVLKLCTFLVCPRAGSAAPEALAAEREALKAFGGRFQSVPMDIVEISSTALRAALAEGTPTPLLPPQVLSYCQLRGLCGCPDEFPETEAWMARLFEDLSRKRFAHTLGVVHAAKALALSHGVDVRKAQIAALLHDCAKCLPLKDMQRQVISHHAEPDPETMASTALLHSHAGACMAETVYGVTDPEILSAIRSHTTGRAGMTKLEMVVYLADKIEPGRAPYDGLNKVRKLAPVSLEKAMLASMEGTAEYVKRGGKLHPQTLATIAWLKTQLAADGKRSSAP